MNNVLFEGRAARVVQGRNGRLFIADYGAPDGDPLLSDRPMPDWRLRQWRLSLEHHARLLGERGIPLVVLVAPDAFTACAEDLPEGWPRPGYEVGRVFAEAMAGIPNLKVVYPLPAIRQAEGGLPTWKRHDTHWSAYGAFVAYRELLAALPAGLGIRRIGADEVAYLWRDEYGDLGAQPDFDLKSPVARARIDGEGPESVRRNIGLMRRSFEIARTPGAQARALIFRDSFASEMRPFLFSTFGETWFLGATQDIDQDLVLNARPNVVIVQTSERRLLRQSPDRAHFGWRELFDIDMSSPAGKACARMVEVHETRDAGAAAALAGEVAAADGLQAQHLVHCAHACHKARRYAEARDHARRAIELDPSLVTAWRLLANAEAADPEGDAAAWSAAARRMLALAPHSPRARHDHAFGLDRFGRRGEAIGALGEAIGAFPGFPELRLLLGRLLRRSGDRKAAVEALAPVVDLLDPRSPQQQAAARFVAGGPWKA